MPTLNHTDEAALLRHPLLAQVAQGLQSMPVQTFPLTPPKPAHELVPIPSSPAAPLLVAFPADMTLGELREHFPADAWRIVRQADGAYRLERRNPALRVVGVAHIIRNAARDAVPTTKEA